MQRTIHTLRKLLADTGLLYNVVLNIVQCGRGYSKPLVEPVEELVVLSLSKRAGATLKLEPSHYNRDLPGGRVGRSVVCPHVQIQASQSTLRLSMPIRSLAGFLFQELLDLQSGQYTGAVVSAVVAVA